MSPTTFLGITGALIILISFFLNETHRIDRDSVAYDISNLIGSSMLVAYAFLISSLPFALLNIVWAFISLKDVIMRKK